MYSSNSSILKVEIYYLDILKTSTVALANATATPFIFNYFVLFLLNYL
jgi:hypothetical protein